MSITFLQSLELGQYIFGDGSLIVTHQDGHVDGSFVLQFLTHEFSKLITSCSAARTDKREAKLLLILNHQSTTHWMSIATKLGWNVSALKDRGQLAVMDLLTETYKFLVTGNTETSQSTILDQSTGNLNLDSILLKCFETVEKLYPPEDVSSSSTKCRKLFIVLEDFTSLMQCASETEKRALGFIQRLRFLRDDLDITVVTLVSSTDSDSSGKYFSNLVSQSMSSLTFNVAQLRTGFSSEVNGVLTVEEHDKVLKKQFTPNRRPKSYHYKLLDRSVRFIPI